MTKCRKKILQTENAQILAKMNSAAAGMVDSLLYEAGKPGRDTFVRLRDPGVCGHRVHYDLIEGDTQWLKDLGNPAVLDFESVTDDAFVVRSQQII